MCQETRNHKSIESLEQSLDRINMWIGNCDQKAGFLLATIGVIMGILFTTDFVGDVRSVIIKPFIGYWTSSDKYEFSFINLLFTIVIAITMVLSAFSAIHALRTISATVSAKDILRQNPNVVSKSYLFFLSISSMEYEEFQKFEDVDYEKDLKSQIYINSSICTQKFKRYQAAMRYFYGVVVGLPIMSVLYLFIK